MDFARNSVNLKLSYKDTYVEKKKLAGEYETNLQILAILDVEGEQCNR